MYTFPSTQVHSYEKMFNGVRSFDWKDIFADMDQAMVDKAFDYQQVRVIIIQQSLIIKKIESNNTTIEKIIKQKE